MLKHYLSTVYNEIISQKDWEEKYSKRVKIPERRYEKVLPLLQAIFTRLNGGTFSNTIVFDYEGNVEKVEINKKLLKFLQEAGYTVNDKMYKLGFAEKEGKQVPITQIVDNFNNKLAKVENMKAAFEKTQNPAIKKNIDELEIFKNIRVNDKQLNKNAGSHKIVITMDPRAIASQSTNVGWRSCMNLDDGCYRHYVGSGIGVGVFIAYLTKVGDESELKSPTARVLIKPLHGSMHKKIYWVVDSIYGDAPAQFRKQVQKIINSVNEKTQDFYRLPDSVYDDRNTQDSYTNLKNLDGLSNTNIMLALHHNYKLFSKIKNPTEDMIRYVLRRDGMYLERIKNPTNEMIETALYDDGRAIQFLKNPKLKHQMIAVQSEADALKYIKNPSEKVMLAAVTSDSAAFKYIDDPSPAVILAAIKNDGSIIKQINNPTKAMMHSAIWDDADNIRYINNPPEDIQREAIDLDAQVIRFIKRPKKDIVKFAIREDYSTIQYIKDPPGWLQEYAVRISEGDAIRYIKHPTERAMKLTLDFDPDNFYWIKRKATPAVRQYYRKLKPNDD